MHEASLRKRLLDNMFYGLTTKRLREIAYDFAEKNNRPHRFNKEEKLAGKEWLRGFLKRHPELSLRWTNNVDKYRQSHWSS